MENGAIEFVQLFYGPILVTIWYDWSSTEKPETATTLYNLRSSRMVATVPFIDIFSLSGDQIDNKINTLLVWS